MMKMKMIIVVVLLATFAANAQDKYFTKTGKIEFFSKATLEDIEAKNKTVASILDTKSGAMQFSVLMKGFEFEKARMQEHFNENYVESDKFPKAEFKGTVVNNAAINYTRDGVHNVRVKGKLTIHGVTKNVETAGTIKIAGGKIETTSTFNILLSDYKVKIPSVVSNKVSNSIKITVDCKLEPLKA